LASKTDANGNTETYTYDQYGRLTGIPDRQQAFTHDTCPPGDQFCTSTPGQLSTYACFGSYYDSASAAFSSFGSKYGNSHRGVR